MRFPEIERLSALLPGDLPEQVVANYFGNLAAGEPRIALEELFDDVELDELALSREQADALAAAAADFGVTRFSTRDVQRLVRR
jgi:hypothetical protein